MQYLGGKSKISKEIATLIDNILINLGGHIRYLGGKSRISTQLSNVVNTTFGESGERVFVSLFCGSCAIESKVNADVKILNDKHPYLIAMWKALQNGWIPPEEISKEQYNMAINVAKDILNNFASRKEELDEFCFKYFKKMELEMR